MKTSFPHCILTLALLIATESAAYCLESVDSSNAVNNKIWLSMQQGRAMANLTPLGTEQLKQIQGVNKLLNSKSLPPREKADRDVILKLNLCAGEDDTMLTFITNKKRSWNYFIVNENARIIISGINPEKEIISVNTIGLVNIYVVESSPLALLSLTPPAESVQEDETLTDNTVVLDEQKKIEVEDAIKSNMDIISDYIEVLQERRSMLVNQACINQVKLNSWLEALVPGTTDTRFRLQSRQQQEIAKLSSDDTTRIKAEEQLELLTAELDNWMVLRGGNLILAPPDVRARQRLHSV